MPQKSITFDPYHLWAVDRIAATLHMSRSDIVMWAVREWVKNYHDAHVVGARATSSDFAREEVASFRAGTVDEKSTIVEVPKAD